MSGADILSELKTLRSEWYESEFKFFKAAHVIEETRHDEWRQDYVTFDHLFEQVGSPSRYRGFIEACSLFGDERVRLIGVEAGIAAAKRPNKSERAKLIEHFEMSSKEHGKPLSERQIKQVVMRLTNEERESGYSKRTHQRESREQDLYAENVELKKKVKVLERENRELRERLLRYEGGMITKKKTSRKPPSKGA